MRTRQWFGLLIGIVFIFQSLLVYAAPLNGAETASNPDKAFLEAVDKARQGQTAEALSTLKNLADSYPGQDLYRFNYTLVLIWAERYGEALEVYESQVKQKPNVPAWLNQAVAATYYRTGQYDAALKLFTSLVASGDKTSLVNQAETLIQLGRTKEGEELFTSLTGSVAPDSPAWSDLMLRRAAAWERKNDFGQASVYYHAAFQAMSDRTTEPAGKKEVAIAAIRTMNRLKNYAAVECWAIPYLHGTGQDVMIQSELVIAHRMLGNYDLVITKADQMWPTYDTVPAAGIQAVADAQFLLGNYRAAIPLYEKTLMKEPSLYWARMSLAYSLLQIGRTAEGLKEYAEVLTKQPAFAEAVANDCVSLVRNGKHWTAERLFNTLLQTVGENAPARRMYADSLLANGLPREAYAQYKALAATPPDGLVTGHAGMAKSALMVGNLSEAKTLINGLPAGSAKDPVVSQAQGEFNARTRGEMEADFAYARNYQKLATMLWYTGTYQNLDDNLMGEAEQRTLKLNDKSIDKHTILNSAGAGVTKHWMDDTLSVRLVKFWNGQDMTGYRATAYHFWNDHSFISVATRKGPFEDVQAIPAGLRLTSYDVAIARIIGNRNTLITSYSIGEISDSNKLDAYGLSWNHLWMIEPGKHRFDSTLFASRLSYRDQVINGVPTLYNSPEQRDRFGSSFSYQWIYGKQYWQLTGTAAWERELPSQFQFAPAVRLEYGMIYSPHRALIVGMEYGAYTPLNQSGLYYGAQQYDLTYRANW